MWTVNFQMFKLDLEKAEEPEIKLPTSSGSSKKQESSRKKSISSLLTLPKPLTVWITINCGKFFKRWEYQTTWPASWEVRPVSSVQSLSCVRLLVTLWTTALQASVSITNSQSLLKLISIESVMSSNHLIFYHPLFLLPSIFPSIKVFSNESALCIRWPMYWSFSFNTSPSNEHSGLISFRMDWLDLLAVQGTQVFSSTTVQKHQFFGTQPSL